MPKKPTKTRDYDEATKEMNGDWQHLIEYCLELYDQIKGSEYRQKKIEEIKKSRRVYEQDREEVNDPWPGASNIELPLTTISIDNLEPRHFAGLVGRKPYVQFVQEGQNQPDEPTQLIEDWWNSELEYAIKIEETAKDVVHELLLEGTVYPLPSYDIDEIIRRDFVFDEQGNIVIEEGSFKTEDKSEPVFEGGKVDLIPFTDVFIPDNVDDWNKAAVGRKLYPTYAELERDGKSKPGYQNIGKWLIKDEGPPKLRDDEQSPAQEVDGVEVTGKETIECIEFSLSYIYQKEDEEKKDIKDWTEERLVVQIALEKQILVRLVKLRELNFKNEHLLKRIRLFREKGRSYGTGIYGKMKAIQDGASKTFNAVMNVADVTMIPWFFFTDDTGLKGDISLHPGKGVPVDSTEGLFFPKFNINPNQFIEFIYVWVTMWERLLSIGDLQVGRPKEDKQTTATEVMAVIQEGNVKHNYQSGGFKEEFLAVIRTLYDLYYQNMPADKTFRKSTAAQAPLTGQTVTPGEVQPQPEAQEVPIPRQAMQRIKNFRLTGSTELMNKLIERKENEDLFNLALNDPAGVFSPIPIRKDLLESYGKDNPEQYLNPFLVQITQLLAEFPQMQQVIEEAVQQVQQEAAEFQALQEADGEGQGGAPGGGTT